MSAQTHPRPAASIAVIASTEMMERFSYYGMRALLVLYLVAGIAEDPRGPGLGMSLGEASSVYGAYVALVYLTPLLGGWVADRITGARRAVLIGGIIIASGHFVMAYPQQWGFWTGLGLIALGTGLLKPNISSMVGDVYPDNAAKRDAGFSMLYMGINAGALLAPLITGTVAEAWGWHWAFLSAGVAMCLALLIYTLGRKTLVGIGEAPADRLPWRHIGKAAGLLLAGLALFAASVVVAGLLEGGVSASSVARNLAWSIVLIAVIMLVRLLRSKGLSSVERARTRAFVFVFVSAAVFYLIFDQSGSVLNLFAQNLTDRQVLGWAVPAPWLQSVNPVFIIVFSPIFALMWTKMGQRIPSVPLRFAFALAGIGLSFWIMIIPGLLADDGRTSAIWWLIGVYLVQTWAELLLSPVGLSASTHLAPKGMVGQVVALWFLAVSVGDSLGGQVAALIDPLGYAGYFTVVGAMAVVASVVAFALVGRMKKLFA